MASQDPPTAPIPTSPSRLSPQRRGAPLLGQQNLRGIASFKENIRPDDGHVSPVRKLRATIETSTESDKENGHFQRRNTKASGSQTAPIRAGSFEYTLHNTTLLYRPLLESTGRDANATATMQTTTTTIPLRGLSPSVSPDAPSQTPTLQRRRKRKSISQSNGTPIPKKRTRTATPAKRARKNSDNAVADGDADGTGTPSPELAITRRRLSDLVHSSGENSEEWDFSIGHISVPGIGGTPWSAKRRTVAGGPSPRRQGEEERPSSNSSEAPASSVVNKRRWAARSPARHAGDAADGDLFGLTSAVGQSPYILKQKKARLEASALRKRTIRRPRRSASRDVDTAPQEAIVSSSPYHEEVSYLGRYGQRPPRSQPAQEQSVSPRRGLPIDYERSTYHEHSRSPERDTASPRPRSRRSDTSDLNDAEIAKGRDVDVSPYRSSMPLDDDVPFPMINGNGVEEEDDDDGLLVDVENSLQDQQDQQDDGDSDEAEYEHEQQHDRFSASPEVNPTLQNLRGGSARRSPTLVDDDQDIWLSQVDASRVNGYKDSVFEYENQSIPHTHEEQNEQVVENEYDDDDDDGYEYGNAGVRSDSSLVDGEAELQNGLDAEPEPQPEPEQKIQQQDQQSEDGNDGYDYGQAGVHSDSSSVIEDAAELRNGFEEQNSRCQSSASAASPSPQPEVETVAAPSASPSPSLSPQPQQIIMQPEPEAEPEFREFDTIMENEDFTMITADTVHSMRKYISSPLELDDNSYSDTENQLPRASPKRNPLRESTFKNINSASVAQQQTDPEELERQQREEELKRKKREEAEAFAKEQQEFEEMMEREKQAAREAEDRRVAAVQAERRAREEEAKQKAELLQRERLEREKLERQRQAAEAEALRVAALEAERLAREEKLEAEQLERERLDHERQAAEAKRIAALERERQEVEERRVEAERLALEEKRMAEQLEHKRVERERLERERQAAESRRIAAQEAGKALREERRKAEQLERERLEHERQAAEARQEEERQRAALEAERTARVKKLKADRRERERREEADSQALEQQRQEEDRAMRDRAADYILADLHYDSPAPSEHDSDIESQGSIPSRFSDMEEAQSVLKRSLSEFRDSINSRREEEEAEAEQEALRKSLSFHGAADDMAVDELMFEKEPEAEHHDVSHHNDSVASFKKSVSFREPVEEIRVEEPRRSRNSMRLDGAADSSSSRQDSPSQEVPVQHAIVQKPAQAQPALQDHEDTTQEQQKEARRKQLLPRKTLAESREEFKRRKELDLSTHSAALGLEDDFSFRFSRRGAPPVLPSAKVDVHHLAQMDTVAAAKVNVLEAVPAHAQPFRILPREERNPLFTYRREERRSILEQLEDSLPIEEERSDAEMDDVASESAHDDDGEGSVSPSIDKLRSPALSASSSPVPDDEPVVVPKAQPRRVLPRTFSESASPSLSPEAEAQNDEDEDESVRESVESSPDNGHERDQRQQQDSDSYLSSQFSDKSIEQSTPAPRVIQALLARKNGQSFRGYTSSRPAVSPLKSCFKERDPVPSPKKGVVFSATTTKDDSTLTEEEETTEEIEGEVDESEDGDEGMESVEESVDDAASVASSSGESESTAIASPARPHAQKEVEADTDSDVEMVSASPSLSPPPSPDEPTESTFHSTIVEPITLSSLADFELSKLNVPSWLQDAESTPDDSLLDLDERIKAAPLDFSNEWDSVLHHWIGPSDSISRRGSIEHCSSRPHDLRSGSDLVDFTQFRQLQHMQPEDWETKHWKSLLSIKNDYFAAPASSDEIPDNVKSSIWVGRTIVGLDLDGSMDLEIETWMLDVARLFVEERQEARDVEWDKEGKVWVERDGEEWSEQYVLTQVYALVAVERKLARSGLRAPWAGGPKRVVEDGGERRKELSWLPSAKELKEDEDGDVDMENGGHERKDRERGGFFGWGVGWL